MTCGRSYFKYYATAVEKKTWLAKRVTAVTAKALIKLVILSLLSKTCRNYIKPYNRFDATNEH